MLLIQRHRCLVGLFFITGGRVAQDFDILAGQKVMSMIQIIDAQSGGLGWRIVVQGRRMVEASMVLFGQPSPDEQQDKHDHTADDSDQDGRAAFPSVLEIITVWHDGSLPVQD